jgi:HD superfamily phosphohydrolase
MVRDFAVESLIHDPIHGYIPFVSKSALPEGEVSMHLASRVMEHWYESLCESCAAVPSRAYVESLVRMAALLHDVGHGPFGHFFDDHYLDQFGLTHEDIGAHIIENELGELLRGIRRNPRGALQPLEELEPRQISWLIRRPKFRGDDEGQPDWLCKLRALFSGIYTVDNMDFVLRDAYMSGYSLRAFDLSRLLHYSFFTPAGLTIHVRGLSTLINFIETRANLFRSIYFHRAVRSLDLSLSDIFPDIMDMLFAGNPLEHLDEYRKLTESTFLVDVQRWADSEDERQREIGERWNRILCRELGWKMACEKSMFFHTGAAEQMSIFSEPDIVEKRVRERLPREIQSIPLKVDVARHYHRPAGRLPAGGQNFLLDPTIGEAQELLDDDLFRAVPTSFLIFRIYAQNHEHDSDLNQALSRMLGDAADAKTNM